MSPPILGVRSAFDHALFFKPVNQAAKGRTINLGFV
jgi:hypothetical protein